MTLTPCELVPRDDDTSRALDAANGYREGRALDRRDAIVAGFVVLAFVLLGILLSGCSSLAALGQGAATARDVAKAGCAILAATDGTTGDTLRATQELQREILTASAGAAVASGADPSAVERDMKTIATLAEALRLASSAIVQQGGTAPAKLPPCPGAPAPSSSPTSPAP